MRFQIQVQHDDHCQDWTREILDCIFLRSQSIFVECILLQVAPTCWIVTLLGEILDGRNTDMAVLLQMRDHIPDVSVGNTILTNRVLPIADEVIDRLIHIPNVGIE